MPLDGVLGNWLWWDGSWYLHIAQHGYSFHPGRQSSVAFFPAYPLVVRAVVALTSLAYPLAAIVVTTLCGLAAFTLFNRWCTRHIGDRAARCAVLALAVYPYAWYLYGAAYSDALFVAATLAAFLLLDDHHPVAAGAAGIVATAARPTGILVAVGLVAVALDRRRKGNVDGHTTAREHAVLLAIVGLLGWCVWLGVRFRHPFAFIETEGAPGWNRAPGVATWLKVPLVTGIARDGIVVWAPHLVQVAVCAAFALALPAVWRRFGRGYGIYSLATVLAPAISTDDFMGTGRYLLAAFPVFAVVGASLAERPIARRIFIVASSAGLVVGTTLFATGHYLA